MTNEDINQLTRIYNTLLLINTKGEDTMLMSDCLRAMHDFIDTAQKNSESNKSDVVEPEIVK